MVVTMGRTPAPITVEAWAAFEVPEGYRAEIIQGELVVTPAPSFDHALVATALFRLFDALLPADLRVMWGLEWLLDERGLVAAAPQPDLLVLPRANRSVSALVLAVEVLSPSDRGRIETGVTRIEGKRLDYARQGLPHYLEVDPTADPVVAVRYELQDATLVEVDRVEGVGRLVADRPFPYELVPADLLRA
jgi:Uma2 family endonuclease